MTGFGRAELMIGERGVTVDVKSLNGKQFDLRMYLPPIFKAYEIDIRNILNSSLERGSVECNIQLKQTGGAKPVSVNTDLAKSYYQQMQLLSTELGSSMEGVMAAILKMPDVVTASNEVLSEAEWLQFQEVLSQAINALSIHREKEGVGIEKDLLQRVGNIEANQAAITQLEPLRRVKIREGLEKVLEENVGKENYDPNRLEQELIYYIERIDISEEQQRLANHCLYFREIISSKEKNKGKKLSFVLQELGREINTMGSKSYDAAMQKLVVEMKDELEKAKEQVLNVL